MARDDSTIVGWFTMNGAHIPIHEGESKEDARKSWVQSDRERAKQSDIERRKAEADVLNEIEYRKTHPDEKESNLKETKDAKGFKDALDAARESRGVEDRWRVDDTHNAQWYKDHGAVLVKSKGGSVLAVTKDGDIVSVCKMRGDKTTTGAEMMRMAVARGGVKLDSFSGNHAFYAKNGFMPVSWTNFDENYAPKGWKESWMGHEPVVFYKYVGIGNVPQKYQGDNGLEKWLNETKVSKDYDTAKALRDKAIKK